MTFSDGIGVYHFVSNPLVYPWLEFLSSISIHIFAVTDEIALAIL